MTKLLIVSFVASFIITGNSVQYVLKPDNAKQLFYKTDRKLTWADFVVITSKKDGYAAISNTGIDIEVNAENDSVTSVEVSCIFNEDRSWVHAGQNSDYVLNHEQGHFDITYVYVRHLVNLLKDKKDRRQVDLIYAQCLKDWRNMQDLYDQQTDFSRNRNKQEVWNKWIVDNLIK